MGRLDPYIKLSAGAGKQTVKEKTINFNRFGGAIGFRAQVVNVDSYIFTEYYSNYYSMMNPVYPTTGRIRLEDSGIRFGFGYRLKRP